MEKDRLDRWMEMGVGGQGNARQEKSVPGRRTEEQVHLKVSPAHARGNHWLSGLGAGGDTALQRRGAGEAGGQATHLFLQISRSRSTTRPVMRVRQIQTMVRVS